MILTDEHMNAVLDNFQMKGSSWLLWKVHKKWRISVALGWIGHCDNSRVVVWMQNQGDAGSVVEEPNPEKRS